MRIGEAIGTKLEAWVFWGLSAVVLWAPLPLASNRLWSWSLLGVTVGLLMLSWAVVVALGQAQRPPPSWTLLIPGLLLAVVVAFVSLQGHCVVGMAHPVWELVAALPATCARATIDPYETWTALARLLTYAGGFWLAMQLATSVDRAQTLIRVLSAGLSLYATYGLLTHFFGVKPAIFFEDWGYSGFLTATFVNRNSFAAFAGMGAVLNLAPLVHRAFADLRNDAVPLHVKVTGLVADLPFFAVGFVLCASAVVLTGSRAGLAASCVGIVALMVTAGLYERTRWRWRVVGTVLAAGLVLLTVAAGGGSRLLNRLNETGEDWASRGIVIGRTLEAAMERPWTGVGYGTFEQAWPFFRPDTVDRWFRQAHSTYAENLLELGLPISFVLMLTVGWILVQCARGLYRRRRDGLYPSAAFSCALVPIAHSTIDFSLQMPAVVLTTVVLLGVGYAQSFPTRPAAAGDKGVSDGG